MKSDRFDHLSESSIKGDDVEFEARSALGLVLPNLRLLERAILDDLQESPPFGISWWDSSMEPAHRILVSDQLYCCATSVSENLSEAGLHRLEFLHWRDQENALISIDWVNGLPMPKRSPCNNALQALTSQMTTLHVAGVARALSSALDCLAGTIVAMIALPLEVLTASFNRVRNHLKDIHEKDLSSRTANERRHADFSRKFEESIAQSGPIGWVEWLLDYRNMLVHRGRRIQMGQIVPSEVLGHDGLPARPIQITHLPRDPGRSDVQVLRDLDGLDRFLLAEDVGTTLNGLIESTSDLAEAVAKELYRTWTWRRKHPKSMVQPREQWRERDPATEFSGYEQLEFDLRFSNGLVQMHPIMAKRLRAAAVDDKNRPRWDEFRAQASPPPRSPVS